MSAIDVSLPLGYAHFGTPTRAWHVPIPRTHPETRRLATGRLIATTALRRGETYATAFRTSLTSSHHRCQRPPCHPACPPPRISPGHLPGQAGVISLHLFASRCIGARYRPHRPRSPQTPRFDARRCIQRQRSASSGKGEWSARSDSNRRHSAWEPDALSSPRRRNGAPGRSRI